LSADAFGLSRRRGGVVSEVLAVQYAQVGQVGEITRRFDDRRLSNPNNLLLVAYDEEYRLRPFLGYKPVVQA